MKTKTTVALQRDQKLYRRTFDSRVGRQHEFHKIGYVYIDRPSGVKGASSVDVPSRKLQAKKLGPYFLKKVWSITAQLDKEGIENIVSSDRSSIATRKEKLVMHRKNNDNKIDVTDNMTTRLDFTERSRNKAGEYVVDKIVGHDVVNGKTIYHVRWYGYEAKQNTARRADHHPDHFIKIYWRRRNRQKCPHRNQYWRRYRLRKWERRMKSTKYRERWEMEKKDDYQQNHKPKNLAKTNSDFIRQRLT